MTITSSDLPGILHALDQTSHDLDALDKQELDWAIDHGDYSDAEKSYLKLDEVSLCGDHEVPCHSELGLFRLADREQRPRHDQGLDKGAENIRQGHKSVPTGEGNLRTRDAATATASPTIRNTF